MNKNLGSGKIDFPKLEKIISRQRLFKQLDASQDKLITWVSGPPGAGKTTLLSSFLVAREIPYLWLRCDKTDNDIASFTSYLSFAAEKIQRGLGKSLPSFTPEYAEDIKPFVLNYFRKLSENLKHETIVVLDDFHEVQKNSPLSEMLSSIAEEFSGPHALVIISRKPAVETLARAQVNQQLLNIEWKHLQLTEDETREYVSIQGKEKDRPRIKLLHKICKGWFAALKLILLSNSKVGEEESTEEPLDQTLFFNYLAQETFNHLPWKQKSALMLLAQIPSITREHLNLVSNQDYTTTELEKLLKQQLIQEFSSPVLHYKFHPLYREFLVKQAEGQLSESNRNQLIFNAADLLFKQGFYYESAELYMQLNHYEKLAELVLLNGNEMCKQGRFTELESWLNHLPKQLFEPQPWLQYWRAASMLTTNHEKSQNEFEQVFEKFLELEDVQGIYLSWLGALEACIYSFKFHFLEGWIERYEHIRKLFPKYPSLEIRMRVMGGCLFAYFLGYAPSDGIDSILNKCYRLVRFVPIPELRLIVGSNLLMCLYMKGDGFKAARIVKLVQPHLQNENIAPFMRLLAHVAILMNELSKPLEEIQLIAQQALDLAEETGIHRFDCMFKLHMAFPMLVEGKVTEGKELLEKLFEDDPPQVKLDIAIHTAMHGIIDAMLGDLEAANENISDGIVILDDIGHKLLNGSFNTVYAEILSETNKFEAAQKCLRESSDLAVTLNSRALEFNVQLSKAVVAMEMQDQACALSAVSRCLLLGKNNNLHTWIGIRRDNIFKVCHLAFEHNIEREYASKLIEIYKLTFPKHIPIVESWPWKLKVRVFKEFDVDIDNESFSAKNKSQSKALELLQVLVAMGGRNVDSWRITEVLWPDAEGDAAHHSLETTTHRLRKLIGKELVEVSNNKLSLSAQHCWTDMWQFEEYVDQIQTQLKQGEKIDHMCSLARKFVGIYTGDILSNVGAVWAEPIRDKARMQLMSTVGQVTDYLYLKTKYDEALSILNQVILHEPMQEGIYHQTMLAYQALGFSTKALDIYRLCEQNLHKNQGISLSSQITQLAESLK